MPASRPAIEAPKQRREKCLGIADDERDQIAAAQASAASADATQRGAMISAYERRVSVPEPTKRSSRGSVRPWPALREVCGQRASVGRSALDERGHLCDHLRDGARGGNVIEGNGHVELILEFGD